MHRSRKWQMLVTFYMTQWASLWRISTTRIPSCTFLHSSSPHISHWHSTSPAGMEQPCDFSHLHHTHRAQSWFPVTACPKFPEGTSWTKVLTPKWRDKDRQSEHGQTVGYLAWPCSNNPTAWVKNKLKLNSHITDSSFVVENRSIYMQQPLIPCN